MYANRYIDEKAPWVVAKQEGKDDEAARYLPWVSKPVPRTDDLPETGDAGTGGPQ